MTVYWHYKQWREAGVFETLMRVLHEQVREQVKKTPKWTTLIIIDSQAVKNTCTAGVDSKGFCFYKATNGIKRHLAVDTLGFRINLIFVGHGQDDVFGKGTLMKAVVAEQTGTSSERWRDARQAGTAATAGMMKMFASTFRRYGVETRMPYYDSELLVWAFSQPIEVLPIEFKKQFVHTVARACLPPGSWLNPKHSIGYLTGAGLSLKGRFKQHPLFQEKIFRQQLKLIKALPLATRSQMHRS